MDTQGHGWAENADPSDQWVPNPQTGEYELRPTPSPGRPPVPGPRRMPPKNISFVTLPVWTIRPTEGSTRPSSRIRCPLGRTSPGKAKEKAKNAARLKGPRTAADVRGDIYNASAPADSAQETLAWLQTDEGVPKASQLGNAGATQEKTTLRYPPDQAGQAREPADIMGLPASALEPGKSETNAQELPAIVLTLGADFRGAGVPLTASTKAPAGVSQSTAMRSSAPRDLIGRFYVSLSA